MALQLSNDVRSRSFKGDVLECPCFLDQSEEVTCLESYGRSYGAQAHTQLSCLLIQGHFRDQVSCDVKSTGLLGHREG